MNVAVHLWQSTLCVGLAALMALALQRAPARTRHAIWLLASLKFLLPFSLLVAAGSYVQSVVAPLTSSPASLAVRWLADLPLWRLDVTAGSIGADPQSGYVRLGLFAISTGWAVGVAALIGLRWREWRDVCWLVRRSTPIVDGREAELLRGVVRLARRPRQIEMRRCYASVEPGIVGIFRPKLLWPAGLSDQLTDRELGAVLSHEACHVDRRDNLSAWLQMVVETVFWVHPAVWWVGARLVTERERACDEEVLRLGADGRSYAEGILKVCGFGLRAPVAFVAGVGGSDLTARITRILQRPALTSLPVAARLALASVITAAVAVPLVAGAVRAEPATGLDSPPSAAAQDKPTVYRPGNGVSVPRLVREVKPTYTPEAMQAKIQGSVRLEAVVLETGEVGDVAVIESLDKVYGLDEEAVKCLRQWRFDPGKKDGKPVAVRIEVEMSFTLK